MSARRAARQHRPEPRLAPAQDQASYACLAIGACVEVWGPVAVPPRGTSPRAVDHFAQASARFSRVLEAVEPAGPNRTRTHGPAWTMDGRTRVDRRMRGVTVDPTFDPLAQLGAAGCSPEDLASLRGQASSLLADLSRKA